MNPAKLKKKKLNAVTQNVENLATVSIYFPFQTTSQQHPKI
jgi:hypothetical protein